MTEKENKILEENAKIASSIAGISIEEATKALLEVMKQYKCDVNDLNGIVDKLNKVDC